MWQASDLLSTARVLAEVPTRSKIIVTAGDRLLTLAAGQQLKILMLVPQESCR